MRKLIFFPPDGLLTDYQQAKFLTLMMELQKRLKEGKVSPVLALKDLQNSIEGKHSIKTDFGILKLFGLSIEVTDFDTANDYGPEEFFKNSYAAFAEMDKEGEMKELLPLFEIRNAGRPYHIRLAPYCFDPKWTIGRVLEEVENQTLHPSITLGHLDNLMTRFISGSKIDNPLFEGAAGNYFLIKDVSGLPWFVWLWLHGDGTWNYKFIDPSNFLDTKFRIEAKPRLWLLSKQD
jgi:hypothetical protein